MNAVDIEEWGFDSHDRNRATDLDVAYEAIHDLERMAQREVDNHEEQPEVNTDTMEQR